MPQMDTIPITGSLYKDHLGINPLMPTVMSDIYYKKENENQVIFIGFIKQLY